MWLLLFQQDGATVHTTIRARSWLKSRFGGSHQPPDQAPVAGKESGLVPPGLLVLECGHDRAQKKTPQKKKKKKALVELKETIESLVNGRISQTGGTGYPAAELAPAWSITVPRLRGDNSGPDSVVLPDILSTSTYCNLSAEKGSRADLKCFY